jgi:hypothetical protein
LAPWGRGRLKAPKLPQHRPAFAEWNQLRSMGFYILFAIAF